ncbi:methyltransferase family protein [Blautia obeum]|uniref:methyltransferase family protein n=1 Tax=Blautia obeum TaxID=40520 RepID=UPI0032BFF149
MYQSKSSILHKRIDVACLLCKNWYVNYSSRDLYSYITLKKAFTLNVQISKEQQLITNGMYKFVRHPAYTGSILSLLGVSIALKNIPAILIVAICSFVCYQIRINVEEAVLQKYFKEYNLYKEKTYKLFPYIY